LKAEIEDLQKSKADPKRIATNLKGFAGAYEGLEAGDRQLLLRFMVKRIRITPTHLELELYDHETVIEDWDGGPDGWFRTRLSWLPTTRSYRTTVLASVDMEVWGFEEAYRAFWEKGARRDMGGYGAMIMVLLTSECEQWRMGIAA